MIPEDFSTTLTTPRCPACKQVETFTITLRQAFDYGAGDKHIQHIFPEMSNDDRERFISGYCAPCWTALFGEDPDDD